MHPPFEINDFEEITRKEARIHFEWYIGEIPTRMELLRKAYHFTTGCSEKDLDYSPESLIPLWEWFVNDIAEVMNRPKEELEKELAETPKWVHEFIRAKKLSVHSQGVSMDVGLYLAETLRKNIESLFWGFRSTPKNLYCVNRPILMDTSDRAFIYAPAHKLSILNYKLVDGETDINGLYKLYEINYERLTEEA